MRSIQVTLGATHLSVLIDQMQIRVAALMVQSRRSAIVTVLSIVPLEVLLGGALG